MRKQFQLLISGHVQGVFYRVSAKQQADMLAINGWVRNLSNGQVEVFAEGDEDALMKLTAWCRKGPPGAHVDDVTVTQIQTDERYFNFVIR